MEPSALRIVTAREPAPAHGGRRQAWVLGALVLLAALGATLLGADRARRPIESRELARRTILRSIEIGSEDAEVRQALRSLRGELGLRPIDARTRAVYATLLIGVSREIVHTRLAAFHATRAAELAPVTVPVIRYAAHVLARAGAGADSRELIHAMFGYDPDSAAELLSEIRPFLTDDETAQALADEPAAWMAWSARLRQQGLLPESETWLRRAHERWPGALEVLEQLAIRAFQATDYEALTALLAERDDLPRERGSARLLGLRAVARAAGPSREPVLEDVRAARSLLPDDPHTMMYCATALERAGDPAGARDLWIRAAFLAGSNDRLELSALVRLARLEDREGSAASALRTWRAVLRIEPDHLEARRRVDDLTGFTR